MSLSRLENFLKNVQGNVIYVNPDELDATDDISNTGNSRTRPFKTIQRALLESARFSYQLGKDNDRFDKTTIVVAPGTHYIDNRPGYAIDSGGAITDVNGSTVNIAQLDSNSIFDIQNPNNALVQFNSVDGGVILPRGTSIVGQDLRKTKIRPKFVPDPFNNNISSTAIFRVTGSCWFFGFSFFDAEPNDRIYKDYTSAVFAPNYSHHKLVCFEYADGVNIITGKGNTDLDMYYYKLTKAYGTNSGRALPNYPANTDFQPTVDEYRIVGAISQIGAPEIEDIYSGATPTSTTSTSVVTVVTKTNHGFAVGTPVLISGVDNSEYDGSYVVSQVQSDTTFTYSLASTPTSTATPSLLGKNATVEVESDSVSSSSPYIFNCSIRSVFGLCGMHANGEKATGFKSMVVAQFTGIALNKDDNAYVKYNSTTGIYEDSASLGSGVSLHTDSLARHKPEWQNFHVKVSKNGIIQAVSVFAIGYAQHFVAESGGDMSITNSNSNFGAKSLESDSFRREAFLKDDRGYITEIIPPQKNTRQSQEVTYLPLDVEINAGLSTDIKLYFYGNTQKDNIPSKFAEEFIFGNKVGEKLFCTINNVLVNADVLMPVPGDEPDDRFSARKEYAVGRVSGINSITGSTFTLQENHKFINGESIRILSKDGDLPDGINHKTLYYAITTGLNGDQIKVASTFNNAINNSNLSDINNLGGELRIVSTVADKNPGDPGHPIQFDSTGWYVNVGAGNTLFSAISEDRALITPKTGSTFITRVADGRSDIEKQYQLRYAIPQIASFASPPQNGFSIEESSSVIDDDNFQNDNTNLTSTLDLRTNTNIINASWSSNVGIITTLNAHRLKKGHLIEIQRLKSANNTTGSQNSGFNGLFEVLEIQNRTTFSIGLNTNPGGISTISSSSDNVPYTFFDRTISGSGRTDSPYFIKRDFGPSYQIYDNNVIQTFKKDVQDGIYDLTILGYLKNSAVSPFSTSRNKFPQNTRDFVPNNGKDNLIEDPNAATSYALRDIVGQVETSDPSESITKESLFSIFEQTGIGIGITGSSISGDTVTVETEVEHGLRGVRTASINASGSNYGTNSGSAEYYYNIRAEGGSGVGCLVDVTVNSSGSVSSITIKNRGSGYTVGQTLTLRGIPFRVGGTNVDATIDVDTIFNEVGEAIQVVGVGSTSYNGLFRITEIPDKNRISYTASVGSAATNGYVYRVGISTEIQSISHDAISGIATVLLLSDIGIRRGDQIVIGGATGLSTIYNGTHFVIDRIGYGSSLSVNIGVTDSAPALSGVATAHGTGISLRSNKRGIPIYGGHTTTLSSGITTTSSTISLEEPIVKSRGDFFLIEDEIVRFTGTGNGVIRGCLGTNAVPHEKNTSARKIDPLAVENRRYSILRASGHTFEYVGFGPGNYSTAMPQTQDRVLSEKEKVISQSLQTRGGLVVYTGMNDVGEFFIGKTKIDATTGKITEIGFEVDATTGQINDTETETLNPDNLTVNENFKSLANSEVKDLQLKGNRASVSDNPVGSVYVGIKAGPDCPTQAQNGNDNILFKTEWTRGGHVGWIKTKPGSAAESELQWKRFGVISHECDIAHYAMDRLGVGVTYAMDISVLSISGFSTFSGDTFTTGFSTVTRDVNIGLGQTYRVNSNPLLPVGMVMPFAGTTAPPLYKFCDGSEYSRTEFAALFEAIGTTYGEGDGSTTFNVPDLRGRVIAAPDNMGESAANRLSGQTPNSSQSTNFNAPGVTGGSQEHVQSQNELRSHSHRYKSSGTVTHSVAPIQNNNLDFGAAEPANNNADTDTKGSSYPMNNVQPTMAMNYIIFANA